MNERIKELARKSNMVEVEYHPGFPNIKYPKNLEIFAELIIRECITQCEKNSGLNLNGWQRSSQIKEYFGVEK